MTIKLLETLKIDCTKQKKAKFLLKSHLSLSKCSFNKIYLLVNILMKYKASQGKNIVL